MTREKHFTCVPPLPIKPSGAVEDSLSLFAEVRLSETLLHNWKLREALQRISNFMSSCRKSKSPLVDVLSFRRVKRTNRRGSSSVKLISLKSGEVVPISNEDVLCCGER